MIGAAIAGAVTAIAAASVGAASAAHGNPGGLATALQHIPTTVPGHAVVSAVQNALSNLTSGIGAAISKAAKGIGQMFSGK